MPENIAIPLSDAADRGVPQPLPPTPFVEVFWPHDMDLVLAEIELLLSESPPCE